MRRAPAVTAVLVLLAGLALVAPGYLTRERDYVAVTPQAPAVESPAFLAVPGDGRACMNLVALDRRSEEARIRPTVRRPVPFEITIRGPGYFARGRAAADYRSGDVVRIPVQPPPRSLTATVCVHNRGRREASLAAVVDRRRSRSAVFVDGVPAAPGYVITFYERQPASIRDRLPDSMRRMSVLRPGIAGPVPLWVLLAIFGAGLPVLALWAYARAVRDDDCRTRA